MKPKPPSPDTALRRQAEARVKAQLPQLDGAQSEADVRRLLHELQVHKIELEMQNAELQLAKNEAELKLEKYSDLYDFAPMGYLTLDRDGTISEANLTCARLLGIERSQLLRRRFGLFVVAENLPEFNRFLKKVFERQPKESLDVSLLHDGKTPVEVRMEAVMTTTGEECRMVVRDITEIKRAERDRLVLSKLESTGVLAGGIAHDFNNLLTVILMNVELGRMLAPRSEELERCLDYAKEATLTAHGLTQQLVTFAKSAILFRKLTVLSQVIRESVRLALGGSRVRAEFSLADDLWPADVDAGQIGQVIRNLIQNSREAMPEGGVVSIRAGNKIVAAGESGVLPPGDYVQISITDQGGGIPKEVLAKIFDPYFSTKQRGAQKGMGLGLTICHSVVEKHGGAISVDSQAGVGTTFHVFLPASQKLLAPAKTPRPKIIPRYGRILVMDDEERVRKVVGALLRRMGHTVELVAEGELALKAYQSAQEQDRPFDAVILDLTVREGVGGQETMRRLREVDSDVRAVVMSGHVTDPVMLDYESHGFKGALIKPFDVGQLQETLSRAMQS